MHLFIAEEVFEAKLTAANTKYIDKGEQTTMANHNNDDGPEYFPVDKWTTEFRWVWFATLEIKKRYRRRDPNLIRCLHEWIEKIEEQEGGEQFRWVLIIEGDLKLIDRCHVLVGAFHNRRRHYEKLWNLGRARVRR